jgi:hypothetical protein
LFRLTQAKPNGGDLWLYQSVLREGLAALQRHSK